MYANIIYIHFASGKSRSVCQVQFLQQWCFCWYCCSCCLFIYFFFVFHFFPCYSWRDFLNSAFDNFDLIVTNIKQLKSEWDSNEVVLVRRQASIHWQKSQILAITLKHFLNIMAMQTRLNGLNFIIGGPFGMHNKCYDWKHKANESQIEIKKNTHTHIHYSQ